MRSTAATLALVLLAAGPAMAQKCTPVDRPSLTVRGTATVDRPPDRAEVAVSVETHGPSLAAVTDAHRARVAQAQAVLDRLKGRGVAVDEGTFGVTEEPVPAAPGVRPEAGSSTFRAETRYDLAIPKPTQVEGVVGAIASAGLFEIGSARFLLSGDASAQDDARRAAFVDARRQAEVYAEAGGLRLDSIDQVVDADAGGSGQAFISRAAVSPSGVGIVPPKTIPFSASVTVTWRIIPR